MKICRIKPAPWFHSACDSCLSIRQFSVVLVMLAAPFFTAQADDTQRVDVFSQLIEMRKGANLFHEKRYSDAEEVFDKIYLDLQRSDSNDLDRLSTVLNFLAQSKSFTGKNNEALVLLKERLRVEEKIYGPENPATAPSKLGLAEAYFRNDQNWKALELTQVAIVGLELLGDEEAEHLALAQKNLKRYAEQEFDASNLPHDLSEFYTHCESIIAGDNEYAVDAKMQNFVELDVDFKPEGFWGTMFEIAASGRDGKARSGSNYRRIFLPGPEESLRNDICVVDQKSGEVVSADNSLE